MDFRSYFYFTLIYFITKVTKTIFGDSNEFLGVKTKGVLFILLKSVKVGRLKKNELLAIFQQMLEDGFWLAPTTAVEFEKMLYLVL